MQSIKSSLFQEHTDLLHAFTTKEGGFSQKPFLGNNLAYHVNDLSCDVDKNHSALSQSLNYPHKKLIRMNQVHGNRVLEINKEYDFSTIPNCDALITDQIDRPLMVMVADCIPILLYDPVQKAIGAVHAGRAGIFSEILPQTITKMKKLYHSQAKDILVALGPSIHNCCYEVGEEIKDEAHQYGYGFAIKERKKSYYLDLLSIALKQLHNINIPKDNIDISTYCTSCNTDLFYSYRAEKECGRFAGLIMLK